MTTLRDALIAAGHRVAERDHGLIYWDAILDDPEVAEALAAFISSGVQTGRVAERARIREAVEALPEAGHVHAAEVTGHVNRTDVLATTRTVKPSSPYGTQPDGSFRPIPIVPPLDESS